MLTSKKLSLSLQVNTNRPGEREKLAELLAQDFVLAEHQREVEATSNAASGTRQGNGAADALSTCVQRLIFKCHYRCYWDREHLL